MSQHAWSVTGLVAARSGKPLVVTVPAPLLILDAVGYAHWLSSLHHSDMTDAEAVGDAAIANLSRTIVVALDEWVVHPVQPCRAEPGLALRTSLTPACVTKSDLITYICKLVALSGPSDETARPHFLLEADGGHMTLYTTSRLRSALRHTGPDVNGVELDEAELQHRIAARQ